MSFQKGNKINLGIKRTENSYKGVINERSME